MRFLKKLFSSSERDQQSTNQPKTSTTHSPELDLLQSEASLLSREGIILREEGAGEPIAYWHDLEPGELCISFKNGGVWLNLYLDDEEESGRIESTPEPMTSDTPLFGEPYRFLPHIDTLFQQGSDAINAFLETNGWSREDPYNDNFPHPAAAAYERLWQQNCPLYVGEIDAAINAYQMPWPDDDWDEVGDLDLILWTFRDAEPWVEVYKSGNDYIVKQRIT